MEGGRGFLLHEGLAALWQVVFRANAYVQERQPWAMAKDPGQRAALEAVLGTLVRQLVPVAAGLAPFMPGKAEELWRQLGGGGRAADVAFADLPALDPTGWRVHKGAGLFPRPEVAKPAA
jgi:methionyl-tRNA synthetase